MSRGTSANFELNSIILYIPKSAAKKAGSEAVNLARNKKGSALDPDKLCDRAGKNRSKEIQPSGPAVPETEPTIGAWTPGRKVVVVKIGVACNHNQKIIQEGYQQSPIWPYLLSKPYHLEVIDLQKLNDLIRYI